MPAKEPAALASFENNFCSAQYNTQLPSAVAGNNYNAAVHPFTTRRETQDASHHLLSTLPLSLTQISECRACQLIAYCIRSIAKSRLVTLHFTVWLLGMHFDFIPNILVGASCPGVRPSHSNKKAMCSVLALHNFFMEATSLLALDMI